MFNTQRSLPTLLLIVGIVGGGLWGVLSVQAAQAAIPLIQNQGSSDFCLFASDAYVANMDMWTVAEEYFRENLPVYGTTPDSSSTIALITRMSGVQWHVYTQGDKVSVRAALVQGRHTVMTSSYHAMVILGMTSTGVVSYLDSLHAGRGVLHESEATLWAWWNGWAWERI